MDFFLGLDLSITNSGVVLLNDSGELLRAFDISSDRDKDISDEARFDQTAERIMSTVGTKFKPEVSKVMVLVEDYAYKGAQLTRLAENAGVIKNKLHTCKRFDTSINVCSPLTLKKFAAGKKAGKGKGPVMVGCYKKWGFATNSDDIADAFTLAKLAKELKYWIDNRKPNPDLLAYEKECVETVRKRNNYTKK